MGTIQPFLGVKIRVTKLLFQETEKGSCFALTSPRHDRWCMSVVESNETIDCWWLEWSMVWWCMMDDETVIGGVLTVSLGFIHIKPHAS